MALSESALSDLLASLQVGDGIDLVRELARWALQELIEAEAAAAIGAGRYERSDGRVTERNGHRPRVLSTKAGDLHVGIPKLRAGSFFPSLLEPRRRIDQALYAVVMEAYVEGISTRAVDDLVEAMGIDSGIKKSEVSRICAGLDERVAAFRNRTLGHVGFPYLYLDATYVHVRDDALGQVVSRAVVIATGITACGEREISASTSATARTRNVLDRLPAWPAYHGGWAGCGSSSPTPTPGCEPPPSARSCRAPRGSAAACTTPATSSLSSPRPIRRWCPRRSARSLPSPTPTTSEPGLPSMSHRLEVPAVVVGGSGPDEGGSCVSTTTTDIVGYQPVLSEVEQSTLLGFPAGFRGFTRDAYALDLRQFTA